MLTYCIFLLLLSTPCLSQNTAFNYLNHGDDWPDQGEGWQQCDPNSDTYIQQSPIDILPNSTQQAQSFLFTKMKACNANVQYLNTTIYAKASPFMGEVYTRNVKGAVPALKFTEMRVRAQSEHTIDQQHFPLEVQLFAMEVYPSTNNFRLAVGLLFEVSETESDPMIRLLIDNYVDSDEAVSLKLDFSAHLNNLTPFDFWYYQGSPTIPPCTNAGLHWLIPRRTWPVSQDQFDFIKALFYKDGKDGNWRKTQALRGNKVNYHTFSSA